MGPVVGRSLAVIDTAGPGVQGVSGDTEVPARKILPPRPGRGRPPAVPYWISLPAGGKRKRES